MWFNPCPAPCESPETRRGESECLGEAGHGTGQVYQRQYGKAVRPPAERTADWAGAVGRLHRAEVWVAESGGGEPDRPSRPCRGNGGWLKADSEERRAGKGTDDKGQMTLDSAPPKDQHADERVVVLTV